jgi:hypothetical protein
MLLDLEKFFDRVNHDRPLAKIAERVSDKRLLRLIGAFLRDPPPSSSRRLGIAAPAPPPDVPIGWAETHSCV